MSHCQHYLSGNDLFHLSGLQICGLYTMDLAILDQQVCHLTMKPYLSSQTLNLFSDIGHNSDQFICSQMRLLLI